MIVRDKSLTCLCNVKLNYNYSILFINRFLLMHSLIWVPLRYISSVQDLPNVYDTLNIALRIAFTFLIKSELCCKTQMDNSL
jgi:hypothetical protein